MPVEYKYNAADQTIEVVCSGELTIGEIMDYFVNIGADASIEPGAVELVDLSQITLFNLTHQEVPEMPVGYESAHALKEIRGTILFGIRDINEGLAALIQAHFNKAMPDHIFKTVHGVAEAKREAEIIHNSFLRNSA